MTACRYGILLPVLKLRMPHEEALTREISSSTQEEKVRIYEQICQYYLNRGCYCLCNRVKSRNKDELARK